MEFLLNAFRPAPMRPFHYPKADFREPGKHRYPDPALFKWMDPAVVRQADEFLASNQPRADPIEVVPGIMSSTNASRTSHGSTKSTNPSTVSSASSHDIFKNYPTSQDSLAVRRHQRAIAPSYHPHNDAEDLPTTQEIFQARDLPYDTKPFDPSGYVSSDICTITGQVPYRGQMGISSNQVPNLPEYLNTCVWIEGAPSDVTYQELLGSIRNCGKIFSAHINPAQAKHTTSAAKIAFCTRTGAERFMVQAHSHIGVSIRGKRVSVRWNRNKYRANGNTKETRVLMITGPPKFVNFETLNQYFLKLFYFDLISVEHLPSGPYATMIWEFSSILAQAHSAKQAIEREPRLMNILQVRHVPDPCE